MLTDLNTEKIIANALFCEDVRYEVGGAQTYIGVVRGTLAVPGFPSALTKFTVVLDVWVDGRQPLSPIDFRIVVRGADGTDTEVARDRMPFPELEMLEDGDPARYHAVAGIVAFSPLAFAGPGTLFAIIAHDGAEYTLPGLRIEQGEIPPPSIPPAAA